MKKTKCAALLLAFFTAAPAFAQGGAAFVNIDRVYSASKLVKAVGDKINADFRERTETLQQLDREIREKREALQKEELALSDAEKEARAAEITATLRQFERDRRALAEDRDLRFQERRKVIDTALAKIIEEIAKERKIDIVLNPFIALPVAGRALTHSILFYASPNADITDEVIERFDKEAKLDG